MFFKLNLQIEMKRAAMQNLESSLEDQKKRVGQLQDEMAKLEDRTREQNVQLTSVNAQVDKLHHDVSGLPVKLY